MVWTVGDTCGLYIDMPLGEAIVEGDWVATDAGGRYLVTKARMVVARKHRQATRWVLQCVRLERAVDVPVDVHCIWLHWYPRGRRRR